MVFKILDKLFIIFILTVGAVMIVSAMGWLKFLVVKTGSMKPTLPVNSLVVVLPQKSFLNSDKTPVYQAGQIVSFKRAGEKSLITHRVANTINKSSQTLYQTKGDANDNPDQQLISNTNILGSVIFSLPILGYLLNLLNSFLGLFLLVILPASVIILHEVLVIFDELKKSKAEDEKINIGKKTIAGPFIIILLLLLATPAYSIFHTEAFLTGNSLSTSETFGEIPAECSGIVFTGSPITGTEGDDNLHGTNGNDLILALGGNDKVNGSGGQDCIVGGGGNDDLRGGSGNDVILAGAGNDVVDGGSGNDQIFGNEGDDNIEGGSGDDIIHGGADNDTLKGGSGSDQIFGEEGNDTLIGSSGADVLDGNQDINTADGGSGTDTCLNVATKVKCEI